LKEIENNASKPIAFISGQWDSTRRLELIKSFESAKIIDKFSRNNFMYFLGIAN
jgi:hypothetical protein